MGYGCAYPWQGDGGDGTVVMSRFPGNGYHTGSCVGALGCGRSTSPTCLGASWLSNIDNASDGNFKSIAFVETLMVLGATRRSSPKSREEQKS